MTILVTGSTGFIGTHLCRCLANSGEKVVAMTHDSILWNAWQHECLSKTIVVQGDIRDFHFLKRVLNQYDISDVYHLAAQSIVKRAWKDPIGTFDINVMGTVKLLEACRLLDVKNVIVQSTDKVYGNQMNADLNCNLKPTEPYGTSKICEDYIARTFNITYGLKILTVRCCNIFGYDWNNRIIPNTIRACLKGESPVIFEDDASVRQYIYIDDVTEILQRLMEEMKMPDAELWHPLVNVGAPIILTQEEVVLKILSTCFPNTFIKPHYIKKPEILEIHSQSMAHYRQAENPTTFENGIMKTVTAFRRYS